MVFMSIFNVLFMIKKFCTKVPPPVNDNGVIKYEDFDRNALTEDEIRSERQTTNYYRWVYDNKNRKYSLKGNTNTSNLHKNVNNEHHQEIETVCLKRKEAIVIQNVRLTKNEDMVTKEETTFNILEIPCSIKMNPELIDARVESASMNFFYRNFISFFISLIVFHIFGLFVFIIAMHNKENMIHQMFNFTISIFFVFIDALCVYAAFIMCMNWVKTIGLLLGILILISNIISLRYLIIHYMLDINSFVIRHFIAKE